MAGGLKDTCLAGKSKEVKSQKQGDRKDSDQQEVWGTLGMLTKHAL